MITRDELYLQKSINSADEQRTTGFLPRRDVAPWPLVTPLDWAADPFNDPNWCFQLNAWRMTDCLLAEYFQKFDSSLLREAMEFAFDWHAFNVVAKRQNAIAWYDMAVGIRAMRLAFFWQAVAAGKLDISQAEMAILNHLVKLHIENLTVESNISINNHGIFQVAGLANFCAVGLADEVVRDFARSKLDQIMSQQFTEEWVHTENSPSYHWMLKGLLGNLKSLRYLNEKFDANLSHVDSVARCLVFPDGVVAPIGDSVGTAPLPILPEEPEVRDFTRSGYAIVRSKESMLFVTGMAHNTIHKHADDLSFHLYEFGRHVFIDPGKYGYTKNDPIRAYLTSAAAHNTISLLEKRISPQEIAIDGSQLAPIQLCSDGYIIKGECIRPALFRQQRTIRYMPAVSIDIVDEVSAAETRSFASSLHIGPGLVPIASPNGFTLDCGTHTMVAAAHADHDFWVEAVSGWREPLIGWWSPSYLKSEEIYTVRVIVEASTTTIRWHVDFVRNEPDQVRQAEER